MRVCLSPVAQLPEDTPLDVKCIALSGNGQPHLRGHCRSRQPARARQLAQLLAQFLDESSEEDEQPSQEDEATAEASVTLAASPVATQLSRRRQAGGAYCAPAAGTEQVRHPKHGADAMDTRVW